MPMRWTISHDDRLVLATAEGPLGLLEIEAYFDALIVAGAQPYAKLLDASSMEVRLSDADMMAIGARMSAYVKDQKWSGGPAAFVVTSRSNREFVKRFSGFGWRSNNVSSRPSVKPGDERRTLRRTAGAAARSGIDRNRGE